MWLLTAMSWICPLLCAAGACSGFWKYTGRQLPLPRSQKQQVNTHVGNERPLSSIRGQLEILERNVVAHVTVRFIDVCTVYGCILPCFLFWSLLSFGRCLALCSSLCFVSFSFEWILKRDFLNLNWIYVFLFAYALIFIKRIIIILLPRSILCI